MRRGAPALLVVHPRKVGGTADGGKVRPAVASFQMANPPKIDELIPALRDLFSARSEIILCFVFGSVAAGRERPESDLDIAIAASNSFSTDVRLDLVAELSRAARREVDLVDLNSATGPILQEILTKGKMVICRDRQVLGELMKRLWYWNADMGPLYRRSLETRVQRLVHE